MYVLLLILLGAISRGQKFTKGSSLTLARERVRLLAKELVERRLTAGASWKIGNGVSNDVYSRGRNMWNTCRNICKWTCVIVHMFFQRSSRLKTCRPAGETNNYTYADHGDGWAIWNLNMLLKGKPILPSKIQSTFTTMYDNHLMAMISCTWKESFPNV